MRELLDAAPAEATVDLERRVVVDAVRPRGRLRRTTTHVRERLLAGLDDIGLTLARADEIDRYERERERDGPSTLAI